MANKASFLASVAKLEKILQSVGTKSSYARINIITRDGIETTGPELRHAAAVINLSIDMPDPDDDPEPEPEPANLHRLY